MNSHRGFYQFFFSLKPPYVPMQLRRERIAERMRALQELVPNTNKVIIHAIFPDVILACLKCLPWNFQQVVQAYDDLTVGFIIVCVVLFVL